MNSGKLISYVFAVFLCFFMSCGGGGGGGDNSKTDFSGMYQLIQKLTSSTCSFQPLDPAHPTTMIFDDVVVTQSGNSISLTLGSDTYTGKVNSQNGFTVSRNHDVLEITNYYNGAADLKATYKYDTFLGQPVDCQTVWTGSIVKSDAGNVTPGQGPNDIPDLSGRWSGTLTLRNNTSYNNPPSTKHYVINVEQSGTAVKVNDGEYVTTGSLYEDYSGFMASASGGQAFSNGGEWWNVSHRLKRRDDGTYTLEVSISHRIQDGMGDDSTNIKYLGAVTR